MNQILVTSKHLAIFISNGSAAFEPEHPLIEYERYTPYMTYGASDKFETYLYNTYAIVIDSKQGNTNHTVYSDRFKPIHTFDFKQSLYPKYKESVQHLAEFQQSILSYERVTKINRLLL